MATLNYATYANCHQTDLQTKSHSNHCRIDHQCTKGLQTREQTS